MCKSKIFISLLIIVNLMILISCNKEESYIVSHSNQLLNNLSSQIEKDFFDLQFIHRNNPYIKPEIATRGDEVLIDSLFNDLVKLELEEPYAAGLVGQIGYPIWTNAKVHSGDSINPAITIPTAGVGDSLTKGIITCVLAQGKWNSYFVRRDTLYSFIGSAPPDDPNIPAYLLGMIYYDSKVFGRRDTILMNMFIDEEWNFQGSEIQIIPRACETITDLFCYSTLCPLITFNGDKIVPRDSEWCNFCETFTFEIGCNGTGGSGGPADVGNGFGGSGSPSGGGTGGGSTGGGSTGGGSTGGGTGGNGCGLIPPYLSPRLCDNPANNQAYGQYNINIYNNLLEHLSPVQAAWLLTQPTSAWQDYAAFINSFSSELLGGFLFRYFVAYTINDRIQHTLDLNKLANLLSPYFGKLDNWESSWLNTNMELLNHPSITEFLDFLAEITFSSTEDVEWAYQNASIRHSTIDFLSNHPGELAKDIASNVLRLAANGWLTTPYPEEEREEIIDEFGGWLGFGLPSIEGHLRWVSWMKILALEWQDNHPGQSLDDCLSCQVGIALEAKWNVISDVVHTVAQITGMIPGLEIADLVDGVIYFIEGDNVNAAFSLASAIPFAGWTANGAKFCTILIKVGDNVRSLVPRVLSNGLIDFGRSSRLRTMLGMSVGDPNHAHHLLSWNKRNNPIIQKAAEAKNDVFHMNHPYNGKPIEAWRNQPNHFKYDDKIESGLNNIRIEKFGGNIETADPNAVSIELKKFQDFLRNYIDETPNLHLDDIPFDYHP